MGELFTGCGISLKGERVGEDLDEPYPIRTDVQTASVSRFRPRVRKRLKKERWAAAFDEEGRLRDIDSVLRHIQRGGVQPNIRNEVWEYLLGVWDVDSTAVERRAIRKQRRERYDHLLKECQEMEPAIGCGEVIEAPRIREDGSSVDVRIGANVNRTINSNLSVPITEAFSERDSGGDSEKGEEFSISKDGDGDGVGVVGESGSGGKGDELSQKEGEEGEGNGLEEVISKVAVNPQLSEAAIKWRWTLHQIGVDVLRTDRSLLFYEKKSNRARLMDLLAVYSWLDDDVGYCQGMSDLMSPLVVLFRDDADAFWCFERLMRQVRSNFKGDKASIGVQRQLDALQSILQSVDPPLMNHLTTIGAGSMFFVVRTVMAQFRRELSFADSLYMWEMMWAMDFDAHEGALEARFEPSRGPENRVKEDKKLEGEEMRAFYAELSRKNRGMGRYRQQTVRHFSTGGKAFVAEETVTTFCVAALLEKQREAILTKCEALDQVMKEFNDSMVDLDIKEICRLATNLHKKLLQKMPLATP